MINDMNDIYLSQCRAELRQAYETLDRLTADGQADSVWMAYHIISNVAERAKERINRIKWPTKESDHAKP